MEEGFELEKGPELRSSQRAVIAEPRAVATGSRHSTMAKDRE